MENLFISVREGGSFQSCKGFFEKTANGQTVTSLIGDCGSRSASEYTYYSSEGQPDYLKLDYVLKFNNPADLPPIPSQYIVQAPFGLIGSYTTARLYNAGNQYKFLCVHNAYHNISKSEISAHK